MKKVKLIALLVVIMAGSVAFAQGPMQQGRGRQMASPVERAKMETERMSKLLGLDAQQKAKIHEISLNYAQKDSIHFTKMQDMQSASQAERKAMRESMQAERKAKEDEIKAVLTEAQKAKYDEIQQQMRERMQQRQQQRNNGGQGNPNPGGQE